jgi:hypothetical protein
MNNKGGSESNVFSDFKTPTSLSLMKPMNIIQFLVFFSPVIFAIIILSISFIFQNAKGVFYLGIFLLVSCIREFVLSFYNIPKFYAKNDICTMVQYSNYSSVGYIIFIATFTAVYNFSPMFFNNDYNYLALGGFLVYLIAIIKYLMHYKCISFIDVFLNMFSGGIVATIVITIMVMLNLNKYLFFNELSSNKDVCSMPSKQTFKCSVYKNGELLATT